MLFPGWLHLVQTRGYIALPEALAVSADYGLTVMTDAPAAAYRFALFILSSEGQRILASYGFSTPNLPE